MKERNRIYSIHGKSLSEADRLAMSTLLIKAGYSVRLGKEKAAGKTTTVQFVEFWDDAKE